MHSIRQFHTQLEFIFGYKSLHLFNIIEKKTKYIIQIEGIGNLTDPRSLDICKKCASVCP